MIWKRYLRINIFNKRYNESSHRIEKTIEFIYRENINELKEWLVHIQI